MRTASSRPRYGVSASSSRSGTSSGRRSPSPALTLRTISAATPPTMPSGGSRGAAGGRRRRQDGGEQGEQAPHREPVAGGDLRVGAERCDQAEADQVGVGGEGLQHRGEGGADAVWPLGLLGGGSEHLLAQVGGDQLVGVEVCLLFGGEEGVEGAAGNARRGGDLADGGVVVAVLGDGGDHAGGEAASLVGGDEGAGQAVAAGGQARQPGRRLAVWGLALCHAGTI